MVDVRILIRSGPNESPRRITKVVPYPSGGFAVMMPYHASRKGWLAKVPTDYNKVGMDVIPSSACTEYEATDRVKLSYHADGFAQFSGEDSAKIQSGRDELGQPKGLGLMTRPITNPITSGPTFGIVCWGIDDFREDKAPSTTDMLFEEDELYHRNCTPTNANGYTIFGFVFPQSMWALVRKRARGGYSLQTARVELGGGVLEWRVIELPNQPIFIGMFRRPDTRRFSYALRIQSQRTGDSRTGQSWRSPDGYISGAERTRANLARPHLRGHRLSAASLKAP